LAGQKEPAGHGAAAADVDPAAHTLPAEQLPEHVALSRPIALPNVPAGHGVGFTEPSGQKEPAGQ